MLRNTMLRAMLTAIAVAIPSAAHADFRYSLTTTTGFTTPAGGVVFGSNPGNFNGVMGGFNFADTSASWTTTALQGNLNSTALTVTNNNGAAASFTIMVSVNALTAPASPLAYASTVSGTWGSGNTGSVASLTSYFGGTGVLFGATNPIAFGPFNGTAGLSFFGAAGDGGIQSYVGTYSMTQAITVTLAAGATVQFTFRTEVTPVPEPATMAGALIGLGCLGATRLRRRKA